MIIDSSIFIAVRCGACSKLETHEISIFQLEKGEYYQVDCLCESYSFYIKTYDFKNIFFKIPCSCCDGEHVFNYRLKDIMGENIYFGACETTREVVLCVGNKTHIEEKVERMNQEIDHIMEELGYETYFHNADIMIEGLNRIHNIAEQHNLYCDCGSSEIDMNLFPDRIELRCLKCSSLNVIYAETREDLLNIKNTHAIIMHEKAFACIDAINYNGEINNK